MTFIQKIYTTLAFLLLLLVGLTLYLLVTESDTDSQAKATEEVTQSNYPGIDIGTEVIEEPQYHMAIHRPVFDDDQLNEEVLSYVQQMREQFLEEVNENIEYLEDMERQANLYLTFDIHRVSDNFYSIVFNTDSFVAGSNGRQSSKVVRIDLGKNESIPGDALLDDSANMRDAIYHQLKAAFESSPDYQDMFFEEALLEWKEEMDLSNLYVTKEVLVFKFDEYEVTAGAAGSPEIALPLEEVRPFLKDEWIQRLAVDEPKEEDAEKDKTSPTDKEEEVETETPTNQPTSSDKKKIAITFDDGPHPENTLKALQLLDKYDMKATFFMLGSRIDFYPDLVQEVFDQGHEIGNHTWNHKQLTKISDKDIKEEIDSVNQRLEGIIGESATVFRPPYGATNNHVESFLTVPSVLWTIDTLDWKTKDKEAILAEVKENLKPGAIILMHDIHATTIDALELVLPYLEEQGYTSVEVSKVL
ncbi:MAG: polysaccharide deacetylase family protein [Bacillota bacterium]